MNSKQIENFLSIDAFHRELSFIAGVSFLNMFNVLAFRMQKMSELADPIEESQDTINTMFILLMVLTVLSMAPEIFYNLKRHIHLYDLSQNITDEEQNTLKQYIHISLSSTDINTVEEKKLPNSQTKYVPMLSIVLTSTLVAIGHFIVFCDAYGKMPFDLEEDAIERTFSLVFLLTGIIHEYLNANLALKAGIISSQPKQLFLNSDSEEIEHSTANFIFDFGINALLLSAVAAEFSVFFTALNERIIEKEFFGNTANKYFLYLISVSLSLLNASMYLGYEGYQFSKIKKIAQDLFCTDNSYHVYLIQKEDRELYRHKKNTILLYKNEQGNIISYWRKGNFISCNAIESAESDISPEEAKVIREQFHSRSCDLIQTFTHPTEHTIQDLKTSSDSAYVLVGNSFFYTNKTRRECEELKINEKTLQIVNELLSTHSSKTLSQANLLKIKNSLDVNNEHLFIETNKEFLGEETLLEHIVSAAGYTSQPGCLVSYLCPPYETIENISCFLGFLFYTTIHGLSRYPTLFVLCQFIGLPNVLSNLIAMTGASVSGLNRLIVLSTEKETAETQLVQDNQPLEKYGEKQRVNDVFYQTFFIISMGFYVFLTPKKYNEMPGFHEAATFMSGASAAVTNEGVVRCLKHQFNTYDFFINSFIAPGLGIIAGMMLQQLLLLTESKEISHHSDLMVNSSVTVVSTLVLRHLLKKQSNSRALFDKSHEFLNSIFTTSKQLLFCHKEAEKKAENPMLSHTRKKSCYENMSNLFCGFFKSQASAVETMPSASVCHSIEL